MTTMCNKCWEKLKLALEQNREGNEMYLYCSKCEYRSKTFKDIEELFEEFFEKQNY